MTHTPTPTAAPAYEHNGQPCTREAFYAVACDPRRSVAVQACAGAGKTWMLVSRMLRALIEGAEPQEILAITFTKKAAGEMRQRLQEWLAAFARGSLQDCEQALLERGMPPEQARQLRAALHKAYPALLAVGRPVQIRTFHSWFAALLRNAPLQVLQSLGLPSVYELLEDDADAVAEVWRRYLRRVAADAGLTADYTALVADLGRHRAHEALQGALAKRVEFALADAAGHVDEAVPAFDAYYPRMAGVAQPPDWLLQREAGRQLLADAARVLGGMSRSFAAKGDELRQALDSNDWQKVLCALFTENGTGTPRAFSKAKEQSAAMEVVKAAQAEAEAVRQAQRQQAARNHHQRMARLTRLLIDEFSQLKRERGWVDMNDIERAALTLLSDPFLSGWVQERLDARVRHLMIDEFQDTNPLQWQALHAWLSSYAGAGGGAGAPSVFIVGDPKQSIYRFRRADPRVFEAAQDFIVQALQGDRLACDHTRRNSPQVLAAVNTVMGAAQDAGQFSGFRAHTTESATPGQVAALPLIARPPRASKADAPDPESPAWRDSLTEPRTLLEDSLRAQECRQAAQWLAARVAAGVPPERLMVLARKREPLGEMQAALRALGLPADQPEKLLLGELPAVQDVLALVDALISPGHDLALAQALKSPLFGLDDEDLSRIALAVQAQLGADDAPLGQAQRPTWLESLLKTELKNANTLALYGDLIEIQRSLLTLPPHDALQALYARRDVLARFAAAAPAPERGHVVQQLRALLGAALHVQGGRFLTAYQWVRALRRQRLAAPRHAVHGAVQLLTVHGAKGLEADEVLLLDAASGPPRGGGASVLIDWPGQAAAPTRLAFIASESAPPPSLADLAAQEAEASAREELNALYVAMTRARQQLVLSGITPHAQPASSWWQRIETLADTLPAPAAASAPARPPDAAFTLPGLPPAPAWARAAPAQAAPAEASEASRLGQAMHWLLEHADETPEGWRPERLAQSQRRFGITPEQARQAQALAQRIRHGQAAWAWSAHEVLQAFNEVELTHQGQRLRIDRLVRRRATATEPESWWVLDYKSAAQPEQDPQLLAQLARYRAALAHVYPGQVVRLAFLSGDGRMVPLDAGNA